MVKRAFDILFSATVLALAAPWFPLVAVAIAIDSRGPVFYRQRRVGRGGEPFDIVKFRTMRQGADRSGLITVRSDPRVTRVGRWLRAAELDELPTFWNVLNGDMSVVGPRPEVLEYVESYSPEQRRVLSVRPGITDLGTLMFRDEADLLSRSEHASEEYRERVLPEKLRLNLEYIDSQSLALDLKIMWRTIVMVVRSRRRTA